MNEVSGRSLYASTCIPLEPLIIAVLVLSTQANAQAQSAPDDQKRNRILQSLEDNREPDLSYADLASKAELIVIATLREKHQVDRDIVGSTDFDRDSVQRVSNKLKVLSVLKGEAKEEIEMISTEWVSGVFVSGVKTNFAQLRRRLLLPSLCAIEIDNAETELSVIEGMGKEAIIPEYLIYLKRTNREGVFTPVSGQRWAGASLRLLDEPSVSSEKKSD